MTAETPKNAEVLQQGQANAGDILNLLASLGRLEDDSDKDAEAVYVAGMLIAALVVLRQRLTTDRQLELASQALKMASFFHENVSKSRTVNPQATAQA